MRFPLASALLLLGAFVLTSGALATTDSLCEANDTLLVPVQTGVGRASYEHAAPIRTTFYLYGNGAGLFLTTLGGTLCSYVNCGPSTVACTAPAGSYVVHVYQINGPSAPWALATLECVPTPLDPCA